MANLFPEDSGFIWIEEDIPESAPSETSFGRSWRFDFAAGEFLLTPTGKVAECEGEAAWVQWCEKAIRTLRYRHLIYSRDYGQEFEDLIGAGYDREIVESEVARMATEALRVDPRTDRVEGFEFDWSGSDLRFSCRVTNVREESKSLVSEVRL